MPTSSQCHLRSQESTPSARSSPLSSKSNRLAKSDLVKQRLHTLQQSHHQSDPSLTAKALQGEGKSDSTNPRTPIRGSCLRRTRSIPNLHGRNLQCKVEDHAKEKKDLNSKFVNGLSKPTVHDGTPNSVYATPRRSAYSNKTKNHITSCSKLNDNQHNNSLKSFSCEINLKLSATPDYYSKVHLETPHRKEEIGNLSMLAEAEASNLTVGVRIRPLSHRELSDPSVTDVVSVSGNELTVKLESCITHTFVYDHCFLSSERSHPQYADQDKVFSTMVEPLIEKMFEGYNACLFAYGQTGSGKSYSMMGVDSDVNSVLGEEVGIIPRFCYNLFCQIASQKDTSSNSITVEISYFEIYNEKIHDLLGSSSDSGRRPLKVREHPVFGPYVEDLCVHGVTSFEDLKGWLKVGNSQRATAATGMNEKSSRSHSIFSVILTQSQEEVVLEESHVHKRRSKINLVDLAGSERISHTSASGDRLREGVSINRSLLTLGKVISALSDNVNNKKRSFVPYRDSVLTWLLRESLGGNSRTAMLATISPCSTHSDETLATLRYACQARTIVNRVRVNEDPSDRLIRELRAEVDRLMALKQEFDHQKQHPSNEKDGDMSREIHRKEQEIRKLKEQLQESQEYLSKSDRSWSERLLEAEEKKSAELKYLKQCGLAIHIDWKEKKPCLVNLSADPIFSGSLIYLLPPGRVQIGRPAPGSEEIPDICLNGSLVRKKHCTIHNDNGHLSLTPGESGQTFVNGEIVCNRVYLHHGDRIVIGGNHYFRVNNPLDPMANTIDYPIDYQFAYQEIHRIQESKLQAELEESKKKALQELEETRRETEKQLGSQRIHYEQELKQLGTTLEQHKDALSEMSRKKEQLEIEKQILEEEVQSHRTRRICTPMEDSFVIAPYKSNFLQEVENILNETISGTENILKSTSSKRSSDVNLYDMQMMIEEAAALCKEFGIKYTFGHEHIVGDNSLKQRVKVKDESNSLVSFWKPSYFIHWLNRLKHHDPTEDIKEFLNHGEDIDWVDDDDDDEPNSYASNNRIMVNTKTVKKQLNESILQLSLDSFDSSPSPESSTESDNENDENMDDISDCIDQIEDRTQELWRRCNIGDKKVKDSLYALDKVIKDLRSALNLTHESCIPIHTGSFRILKEPNFNTPPAKSSLRSPASGQKTPKSVRFLLTD